MTSTSSPKPKSWSCPNCPWVETAHPIYGWASHNEHAVEVHKTMLCPALKDPKPNQVCNLGHLMEPNPTPGPGRPELVHIWAAELNEHHSVDETTE